MIPFRSLKLAMAATLLLAGASAIAENKKITDSGDWSLWETKVGTNDVCYIQSGGENDWYMVMIKPKNSPRSELIKEPEWFSASPTSVE